MSDETMLEGIVRAVNAINAQHPQGSQVQAGEGWVNETDGNGRRVLRLEPELLTAIVYGLGLASGGMIDPAPRQPTAAQKGWAAIIDAGLMARGAAGVDSAALRALQNVDVRTLERMAEIVLGDRGDLGPDTPETVAAKCKAARGVLDAFRGLSDREGGQ